MSIDLNADVGEGFDDRPLMAFVTSVNVACGGHAGDERTMAQTVEAALRHSVAIGAHPSYPDREGFGRRELTMSPADLDAAIRRQVLALAAVVSKLGARLVHVKPHGALYNHAARDADVARVVVRAVRDLDRSLRIVGLAGSPLLEAAARQGLASAAEAFADRGYAADGSLLPRGERGAAIDDPVAAAAQAVSIARDGEVIAADGSRIRLRADTLCLHGDAIGAATIARAVRERLREAGIEVAALR